MSLFDVERFIGTLGYLRDKSGVEPLSDSLDPIVEYKRLRKAVSQGLHRDTALGTATALYERTLAWFVRMFTPLDTAVLALRGLAAQPWQGPGQLNRLREVASNPHHLRAFFTGLADPAWLDHLYDAGYGAAAPSRCAMAGDGTAAGARTHGTRGGLDTGTTPAGRLPTPAGRLPTPARRPTAVCPVHAAGVGDTTGA